MTRAAPSSFAALACTRASARPRCPRSENSVALRLHLLPRFGAICTLAPRISARRRVLEGTLDVDAPSPAPDFMHTIYTGVAKTSGSCGVVTARWVANPTGGAGHIPSAGQDRKSVV